MFHESSPAWIEYIKEKREAVQAIRIPYNIEPSQGKMILSQLDHIYGDVRIAYGDIIKQYEEVTGLIERIRRRAEGIGTNTEVRKANGIRAVENVELGSGETVNLYNTATHLSFQKEDLEGLLAVIEKKQSMIITMSGFLKIESTIAGH